MRKMKTSENKTKIGERNWKRENGIRSDDFSIQRNKKMDEDRRKKRD